MGSSARMMPGLSSTARAMATRCFSPRDSARTFRVGQTCIWFEQAAPAPDQGFRDAPSGEGCGQEHVFQRFQLGEKLEVLKDETDMLPAPAISFVFGSAPGTVAPQRTVPLSGSTSPLTTLRRELLPDPEAPRMPMCSPEVTLRYGMSRTVAPPARLRER